MEEYKKRVECAICDTGDNLETIIEYGDVPLAGFFPREDEMYNVKKYDLALQYCTKCHLMQTNSTIDPDVLFKDYRYLSSIALQNHFDNYSDFLIKKFQLDINSKVLEFGSNDGVLLKPMLERGIDIIGFEPSDNVSKISVYKGCKVINDYFNIDKAKEYCGESVYDIVTSSNCFAHIDDIHSVVDGISYVLKKGSHYVFEVHYGKNIIEECQYDNVYHEHIYYYTLSSLKNLFESHDMTIIDYVELPIHAGSIRVTVKNEKIDYNDKILSVFKMEQEIGITSLSYYENFKNDVSKHKEEIYDKLISLKSEGYNIGAYGASGRANILCNFCNLGENIIDYIIDESPERYDRYINNIPIYNPQKIDTESDYILIFAWNYSKMIISKLVDKYDFKYIIPFPEIRCVNNVEELENKNTL